MTENEKLLAHLLDLKEKAAQESIVTWSNFMSMDELSQARKTERFNNEYVESFYYGGYDEAERCVAIYIPKFYCSTNFDIESFLDENGNPLCLLSLKKDKFSKLSHRDYLGALMGLGIKREMIGDIIIDENGAYLFCLKSISGFLKENLKQAGRGQLVVREENIISALTNNVRTETFFASVASLRLDCLVSSAFNLSRNTAVESINQGLIFVNGTQISKIDYILKQGDKLVFRGKGKTVIDEIIGENKKGRIHLNIKRYL